MNQQFKFLTNIFYFGCIILLFPLLSTGQIPSILIFKASDPVRTQHQFSYSEELMRKGIEAFNSGDYKKSIYFIRNSRKGSIYSASYFYYYGLASYHLGKTGDAKKLLKTGFRRYGCWECNEKYDELFGKK